LANLDDDGDSRKSAMKTLKSYVIGLDSKATPQFLAQVSSTEFQGNISNFTCSRRKQKKREKEAQKTAQENPDLRGANLVCLNALFLNLFRFRTFCFLICVKKEVQRGVSRRRRRKRKKQKASV
jgi:hypothetical protein